MRGAEDAEKRGAEGADGVGSGEWCLHLQLGCGLESGYAPPQEIFVKFIHNRQLFRQSSIV